MAFSKATRDIIRRRANYVSEIDGTSNIPLQCAHISHTRGNGYNSPSNGLYLTIEQHLIDHLLREGENGLSRYHNYLAVEKLSREVHYICGKEGEYRVLEYINKPNAIQEWRLLVYGLQRSFRATA